MKTGPLLIDPRVIKLEEIRSGTETICLIVTTFRREAACPQCKNLSSMEHSKYERKVADLPWQGITVEIKLKSRRFFCKQDNCSQKIFCERLPTVVAYYGRKTARLIKALQLIG